MKNILNFCLFNFLVMFYRDNGWRWIHFILLFHTYFCKETILERVFNSTCFSVSTSDIYLEKVFQLNIALDRLWQINWLNILENPKISWSNEYKCLFYVANTMRGTFVAQLRYEVHLVLSFVPVVYQHMPANFRDVTRF